MDHVRIEKGEMVRIRIVGTRVDAKEIVNCCNLKKSLRLDLLKKII